MDVISKVPTGIIETILCLLPIHDAARTSILSKEWRYHWINIPKLEFAQDTFQVSTDEAELSVLEQTSDKLSKRKRLDKRQKHKLFYAIYQVLLMHQGPIHDFTLSMIADNSCVEIDHILLHLSKKNTVKKLSLKFAFGWDPWVYVLPISLFSLHQLTELYLCACAIFRLPSFIEFGCLTTLHLDCVWMDDKMLLRLLSGCPLLKRFTLHTDSETLIDRGESTIVDLFKCLPVIEYLSVSFDIVECFVPERLPEKLPTTLIHLKCLCIGSVCFSHKYGLPFLVLLIRSAPNLEKLQLDMVPKYMLQQHQQELQELQEEEEEEDYSDIMGSSSLEGYSDITFEHLNELEILYFSYSDNELDFVDLVLAKSPVLKKVLIRLCRELDLEDDDSELLKNLSWSPSASPGVKIAVSKFKSS